MTVEEFLSQYQDTLRELQECRDKLLELEYPARGNKIASGDHSGISNIPEELTLLKDKTEKKMRALEKTLPYRKKLIEGFLRRLNPRKGKILRRKYIDGLNTFELASWMHVQPKSAIAALKYALEDAAKEYEKMTAETEKEL